MSDGKRQRLFPRKPDFHRLSRRDFLRLVSFTAASAWVAGCQTQTPVPPDPTATTLATTAGIVHLDRVAISRADTYDRGLVRQQIEAMLNGLGSLRDIVRPGARVVIKTNLTSGNHFKAPDGLKSTECYATHPEVVRAVGELARDAGASQVYIVEAVYDQESYSQWGYVDIAKDLNAILIDLNLPAPDVDFAIAPVGAGWLVYESFMFNRILEQADTFISIAKMKCHWNCGVTLSMKNLIGLVPVTHYRQSPDHWWRSVLHGSDNDSLRLPRIILDLNRARPIHLAVIDGIMAAEGGEVPRGTFKPVQPGVLVAGKNPVATDAVATAVMSFDPTVGPPTPPFLRDANYLNMATELGMGTNRLEQIKVMGARIDEVRYKFNPAWKN